MSDSERPHGTRGSWFAEWQGVSYPCVHSYWREQGDRYCDPQVAFARPQTEPYLAAIRRGLVLETWNAVPEWERVAYLALWEIADVSLTQNGEDRFNLRFRFVRHLRGFAEHRR